MKPPPPDSKGKGLSSPAALALAAAVMVVPANLLPVLSTRTSGEVRTDTIFSGIVGLWKDGMWGIAAIVFTASIIIPILKLAGLELAPLVRPERRRPPSPAIDASLCRPRFYRPLVHARRVHRGFPGRLGAIRRLGDRGSPQRDRRLRGSGGVHRPGRRGLRPAAALARSVISRISARRSPRGNSPRRSSRSASEDEPPLPRPTP